MATVSTVLATGYFTTVGINPATSQEEKTTQSYSNFIRTATGAQVDTVVTAMASLQKHSLREKGIVERKEIRA